MWGNPTNVASQFQFEFIFEIASKARKFDRPADSEVNWVGSMNSDEVGIVTCGGRSLQEAPGTPLPGGRVAANHVVVLVDKTPDGVCLVWTYAQFVPMDCEYLWRMTVLI